MFGPVCELVHGQVENFVFFHNTVLSNPLYDFVDFRNLQAAVWSYYEYNQPSNKGPQFKFIGDITEGEGEDVPPNTRFTKTWRISNSGMWIMLRVGCPNPL